MVVGRGDVVTRRAPVDEISETGLGFKIMWIQYDNRMISDVLTSPLGHNNNQILNCEF